MMDQIPTDVPSSWVAGASLAYMAVEYWLGKTTKVGAGSTVELVFQVLKAICLGVQARREKKD